MNKNAYEIRLEILKMAHESAISKYHHRISVARDNAQLANVKFNETLIESLFPKSEEIISRSEELYKFVEGK